MLSNFSSLIELFSAVYITMCIDNSYCRNFWTPSYFDEMDKLLGQYDFSQTELSIENLKKKIKATNSRIQKYSQYKGAILLNFCILLLIFIGFENEQNCDVATYAPMVYVASLVAFVVCFANLVLRSWRWVCSWTVFLFCCYFYLKHSNFQDVLCNNYVNIVYRNFSHFIVAIIIIPVLHQLYLDWLYSRIYKGYLKKKLEKEYTKYQSSLQGIKTKNKKLVHKHYMPACIDICFETDEDEDESYTAFNRVLQNRLVKATSPSQINLIFSLIIHWGHRWLLFFKCNSVRFYCKRICLDSATLCGEMVLN